MLSKELIGDTDTRMSLAHVGAKWKPGALADFLMNPGRDYAWTRMPDFRLTEEESGSLVQYLLSTPAITLLGPPGDAARGRGLTASSGCLNCHTITGHTSTATMPSLEALQAADWSQGCLAPADERGGTAPRFDLTTEQHGALRAFAAKGWDSLERYAPVEFASRQVETLNCLACHARDGRGDFWSTLDPVEPPAEEIEADVSVDDFFAEVESTDETIHVGRPPLDWAGEKLRPEWTGRMLAGKLEYKSRPGLKARMPGFPAYAENMAQGLAAEHGFGPSSEALPEANGDLARLGRDLAGAESGFNCVSCHSMGSQKALAGEDTETINFALVPERLRRSYYERFLTDPPRLLPGTKMPQFINPDRTTALKDILDGDADRQFDALWNYFVQLNATTQVSQLAE